MLKISLLTIGAVALVGVACNHENNPPMTPANGTTPTSISTSETSPGKEAPAATAPSHWNDTSENGRPDPATGMGNSMTGSTVTPDRAAPGSANARSGDSTTGTGTPAYPSGEAATPGKGDASYQGSSRGLDGAKSTGGGAAR